MPNEIGAEDVAQEQVQRVKKTEVRVSKAIANGKTQAQLRPWGFFWRNPLMLGFLTGGGLFTCFFTGFAFRQWGIGLIWRRKREHARG